MAAVALPQSVQQMPRFGAPEARLSLLDRSDVLIVTPASTSATRLLVERARRAGVPIIAESISYPGAIAVVAIDDYRAGVELAHWVGTYAQRHMTDEVRALDLTTTLPNTAARSRGFAEGLRQVLPNGRILLSVDGGGLRDQARQMVIDVLAVHPEINVIFAINDDSAQGALDAYRAAGLDERKLLVVVIWTGGGGIATITPGRRAVQGRRGHVPGDGRPRVHRRRAVRVSQLRDARADHDPLCGGDGRHVGAVLPVGAADGRFAHQLGGGRAVAFGQCRLWVVG